jgi:hypothetical protein
MNTFFNYYSVVTIFCIIFSAIKLRKDDSILWKLLFLFYTNNYLIYIIERNALHGNYKYQLLINFSNNILLVFDFSYKTLMFEFILNKFKFKSYVLMIGFFFVSLFLISLLFVFSPFEIIFLSYQIDNFLTLIYCLIYFYLSFRSVNNYLEIYADFWWVVGLFFYCLLLLCLYLLLTNLHMTFLNVSLIRRFTELFSFTVLSTCWLLAIYLRSKMVKKI